MNDACDPIVAAHAALYDVFDQQQRAFADAPFPTLAQRLDRLQRLARLTSDFAIEMTAALSADFGQRPAQVTRLADHMVVAAALRHAQRRLGAWMKPRRRPTALAYRPGSGGVHPQPLGVVGIVAPWNYPLQLSLGPAVSALSAGNRVLIKPSEHTPRFSALLARAVSAHFAVDELAVVQGDAAVARAFVSLPFNHLLFTGSTAVGREVAQAAAAHLTPVTLELGGKSPALLAADCDLALAVPRLLMGKLFNAGQTCIAPDYVLIHQSLLDRFVPAMQAATERLYPTLQGNPDCTSLVNDRQQVRLEGLVADALSHGARAIPLHWETPTNGRLMAPLLLLDVDDRMQVMQQEIFGPLLPVMTYSHIDDALAYVNRHPRPLALYWFGKDAGQRDHVLRQTLSGGVTINDCLLHAAQDNLPFGGVGASGHGRWHGVDGFDTFSHLKAVFQQSPYAGQHFLWPPYRRSFERMARWVEKLL